MSESELEALLKGSVEIARLKKELGNAKLTIDMQRDLIDNLRAKNLQLQSDFDLACDGPIRQTFQAG